MSIAKQESKHTEKTRVGVGMSIAKQESKHRKLALAKTTSKQPPTARLIAWPDSNPRLTESDFAAYFPDPTGSP